MTSASSLTPVQSSSTQSDLNSRSTAEGPSPRDVGDFERHYQVRERSRGDSNSRNSETCADDSDRSRLRAQLDGTGIGSLSGGPRVAAAAVSSAAPAAGAVPFDELVARYVQQLAVTDPATGGPAKMLLKLDGTLLPGTELFLTKLPDGWHLQANVRSADSARFFAEHGPALERRFALKRLGVLRIETRLQSELPFEGTSEPPAPER